MRKLLQIASWLLLLLLMAGCGGAETAAPEQPTENIQTNDKETAAKPQLIEFYADW